MPDPDDEMEKSPLISDALARELGIPVDTPGPETRRTMGFSEAGEGLPTGEMHQPTEAEIKARGRRNVAIALAVVAFVVLVYLTTFFRLAENIKAGAGA